MEELGCHFKFEKIIGNKYHETKLMMSSGRNCLRYIIKERGIKTLFLPYFLCESLSDVAIKEGVQIKYYHIDENFYPIDIDFSNLNKETYIYIVNYYGLFRDRNGDYIDKYKYVILDNTHDFFDDRKYSVDIIYNYRKYFGVPDGACIISNDLLYNPVYPKGTSLNKIIEMVSRDETGEFFHYPTFLEADKYFQNEGLSYMSNFTENYLGAIDYNSILKRRIENFKILSEMLKKYNENEFLKNELTYMYPLFTNDGEQLRTYLKDNNIYSLRLWANIDWNGASFCEKNIADKVVLLPIDQRYSDFEMEYIGNKVISYFSQKKLSYKHR